MDSANLSIVDHDETCEPDKVAEIMVALASPTRLEIVSLLADAELDVTEVARHMGVSVANTSHHLGLLRRAGLVISRRQGTRILNRVANAHVVELCANACALADPTGAETSA
jgi:DNA-binding transcriptional ArsR family regulator